MIKALASKLCVTLIAPGNFCSSWHTSGTVRSRERTIAGDVLQGPEWMAWPCVGTSALGDGSERGGSLATDRKMESDRDELH
jgi:hypothetical protein